MTTYVGAAIAPLSAADYSADREAANNGTVHAPVVVAVLVRSDNPNNVAEPTVVAAIQVVRLADITAYVNNISGSEYEAQRIAVLLVAAHSGLYVNNISGSLYEARVIVILTTALNSVNFLTLAGKVYNAISGQLLPNVRIFFQGENIAGEYKATMSDDEGGYIAILTPNVDYQVFGSKETACLVFELDRIEASPGGETTDIYLRVPEACRLPEPVVMAGEPLEDVLNREVGFHDYEPMKVAYSIRPDKELNEAGKVGLVAVDAEVAVVDFVADNILLIDHIPISSSGDAEFYFVIGDDLNVQSIPRRRLQVDVPQDDLLGGGTLSVNTGQRVRVMGKNVSAGLSTLEASVLGKKA